MKKMTLAAAMAVGLLGAAGLSAKGTINPGRGSVAQATIAGTPLSINVGDDNSFQVFNSTIGGGTLGQIYPTSGTLADMGWFVRVGSALTAPSFGDHSSGSATGSIGASSAYGGRTISAVTGSGTAASPFSVTVQGTAAGMAVTQTVTYVNGENFFRKSFQLSNSGSTAISARVFLASDIYLANSDNGKPFREPNSGSPGGQTCAGVTPVYTILHISQGAVAANGFTADGYNNVWTQVGAGALNNTVNPGECLDNGAGLQWDVTVPAGGNATVQAATSFGDIPVIVGPPAQEAVSAPALGSWGLAALALALVALAGIALNRRA